MKSLARYSSSYLLAFGLAACGADTDPPAPVGVEPDETVTVEPDEMPPAPNGPEGPADPSVDPIADPSMTLRIAAEPLGRAIGVAVRTSRLGDSRYVAAAREFSSLTHENEMKWETIEPQPGVFDFTQADRTLEFAESNGMSVRGHTLVWHSQLASWVRTLTTREEVLLAMERHITEVVGRYRGRVFAWDVVNEAVFTQQMAPPRLRGSDPADADDPRNAMGNNGPDSIFRRLIGEDYIDRAFALANAADPDAKLFYNDFGADGLGGKSDFIYEMVRGMVERGVPIHGVGLQGHLGVFSGMNNSAEAIAQNMQRIAELGLEIHITELDVSLCGAMSSVEERRQMQRERIAAITQACVEQPACTALTFWGVADPDSWRDAECQMGGGRSEPLLFDASYQRKDSYYGVLEALLAAGSAPR